MIGSEGLHTVNVNKISQRDRISTTSYCKEIETDTPGSNYGSATEKLYDLRLDIQPLCASVSPSGKQEQ